MTAGEVAGGPRARPLVVVAGRPNVGKSSLVNRIVGHRVAVVEESPGVTRDRKAVDAEWCSVPFRLMDTGGWMARGGALDAKVSRQAEQAVAEADLVLFVVDVNVGVTEEDEAAARAVLRAGVPVRLVANKVDDGGREPAAWEFVSLGMGDPWPVSAIHGRGTGDLLDEVVRSLAPSVPEGAAVSDEQTLDLELDAHPGPPSIALVGRPNVGKSTLFNRLIGEERSIVHDMPGTTRDTIDTVVTTAEGALRFVDTAGMRRPARAERGVESYSVLRALDALDRADIAMLVVDATVGATHQDQRLAERIGVSGCAAVVVVNKWDLISATERDEVLSGVGDRLAFLGMAPVLKVSATSGRGVHRIVPALHAAVDSYHQRIPTGALNRALNEIQAAQAAPGARIRYGVQGAVDPPTFTLFATGRMPQTYLRFVERKLREKFDLGSTPLKLRVRAGGGR